MTLLLAIGNTLRRDDGAAGRVLELLGPAEGVTAIACHQLMPELAEDIGRADSVVFLDADLEPGTPRIERLEAVQGGAPTVAHFLSPAQLLALAALLYSFHGPAWLCRIPGEDFSDGFGLSEHAEANARAAANLLAEHLGSANARTVS